MIATQAAGLPLPSAQPVLGQQVAQSTAPQLVSLGGMVTLGNAAAALQMGAQPQDPPQGQNEQLVQALAGRIRSFFHQSRDARRTVDDEMLEAMLARRGEYTSQKEAEIKKNRQPVIYMMVAAGKMRQVESLLRDVLIGTGSEKPWTVRPTPVPDLPPAVVKMAVDQLTMEIEQAVVAGIPVTIEAAQRRMREIRDEIIPILNEEAAKRCERMESRMEDQLVEGGFLEALDQFITDLATYKTAFLEGPIVRKTPKLQWDESGALVVDMKPSLYWERRDPFDVYPAPWARDVSKDDVVIMYHLTRTTLNELIGVEGYNEAAIRKVLDQFDDVGFREWATVDSEKASAEGRDIADYHRSGLIDVIRYFGSASGSMLIEWGMDKKQVPDPNKEYQIEAWMAGSIVFKAVLNADPLARRPLYGASFNTIPGSVWGNSPYDLMKDCQDMCNAAARSLAANLGIASGPQVAVISNRIPSNEDITEMFPWKIWQFESDPMGSTAAPIQFFQPQSNAQELMGVYERFSALADEYTGIPRYMAGFETAGAGRTASGMSMMIGNASKVIKQVLGTVDTYVLSKAVERLYYYNMRYGDDPELKGDVRVMARGATSLAAKESAQVRMNEFLQATGNPIDMQIIGLEGRAELLRHTVKRLDVNPDKVVPNANVIKQREAMAQAQQMLAVQQGGAPGDPGGAPGAGQGPNGGPPPEKPSQERLMNDGPVTDNFSPTKQRNPS